MNAPPLQWRPRRPQRLLTLSNTISCHLFLLHSVSKAAENRFQRARNAVIFHWTKSNGCCLSVKHEEIDQRVSACAADIFPGIDLRNPARGNGAYLMPKTFWERRLRRL